MQVCEVQALVITPFQISLLCWKGVTVCPFTVPYELQVNLLVRGNPGVSFYKAERVLNHCLNTSAFRVFCYYKFTNFKMVLKQQSVLRSVTAVGRWKWLIQYSDHVRIGFLLCLFFKLAPIGHLSDSPHYAVLFTTVLTSRPFWHPIIVDLSWPNTGLLNS